MNARPFSQAVSWPGTTIGAGTPDQLEEFIAETFSGTRAKYIGCFLTKPDVDRFGESVPDTGGRSDLCFYVHEDDMGKFAVQRLQFNMRWVDDVIANEKARGTASIYVQEFHDLCSWSVKDFFEKPGIDELLNS